MEAVAIKAGIVAGIDSVAGAAGRDETLDDGTGNHGRREGKGSAISGEPANIDDVAKRHEQKPAWDNVFVVNSAATVGVNFKADFARAAILFQQPHHEQPNHG